MNVSAVLIADGANMDNARIIANKVNSDIVYAPPTESGVYLICNENGLSLSDGIINIQGDFSHLLPRTRKNNLGGEMLVRAAKIKGVAQGLTLVDATAGMGEDSFLLAAAGFTVTMYEQNPVIAALLHDALNRAATSPNTADIVSRMTLIEGDSIVAMNELAISPDVILLDPMFPERQKSGLIKKKFQLLHHLETPCTNCCELLTAAVNAHPKRIVIKRPVKSEYLANVKPSYSLTGNSIRYDCIVL